MWFLYAVTSVGILANTMITPNIPDVLRDLDRDDGSAGLLVAAGALPAVLIAPLIGIMADRFGRKRVLLPCLIVFGLGAIAGAFAPDFNSLLAARFVQGGGGAGLINLALVLIGDNWSGLDRTRLIGRNSAVLTAALAVFPLLSGLIAEVSGWRASVAVGGLALPVAIVGFLILPDLKPERTSSVGNQLRGAALVIRQPIMLFVFASGFLLFVVIFGVFLTALPVHLKEQFDLGPAARGLVLSIPAIGATVAGFNLGRVRTIVDLRLLLSASCFFIAVAAFGVAVAPLLILVVVAMLLYGFGDGSLIPALQDVASSVPPPEQRASVMAAWVVAIRAGQTAGPLGAAVLFAAYSTEVAMIVGAVIFAVVGAMFMLGPIDDRATAQAEPAAPPPADRR